MSRDQKRQAAERRITPDEAFKVFEQNYAVTQYHFVQCLSEHLIDCNRVFSGDFVQVVVLAALGQRYIEMIIAAGDPDDEAGRGAWMSAQRLSDVTGVPRETVRRKLRQMEQRGWVRQDPGRGWTLRGSGGVADVAQDLHELDQRGMQRLARLYARLQAQMPD